MSVVGRAGRCLDFLHSGERSSWLLRRAVPPRRAPRAAGAGHSPLLAIACGRLLIYAPATPRPLEQRV